MEEAISISINPNHGCSKSVLEKKARPEKDQALNCPRCSSTNTKFCYYNNYSLAQPRYFCKTCRRYWTEGGTLRNVPVGGGSRKNKRSSSSSSSASLMKSHLLPDLNPPIVSHFSSPSIQNSQDLNLAFPFPQSFHGISHFPEVPKIENNSSSSSSSASSHLSAMEFLESGITSRGLSSSFFPAPVPESSSRSQTLLSSGFPLQLNFSAPHLHGLDHHHHPQNNINSGGRFLFPFGELKQQISTTTARSSGVDHESSDTGQGHSSTPAYWNNGMFGGGSW